MNFKDFPKGNVFKVSINSSPTNCYITESKVHYKIGLFVGIYSKNYKVGKVIDTYDSLFS